MADFIQTQLEDGLFTITLNRPEKFNSFIKQMAFELQDALDEAATNDQIRAVLLTATGKAFCAGQDLKEATDPNGPELTTIVKEHYNPMISKMRHLPKPIIVAVNGVAAGAGANIAIAGDIVVAAESAIFVQAFSKIGLIPDSGGTFMLPRLVGLQRATALMMTAEPVSARDAVQMGMIYKSFPDEEFVASSVALAKKIAAMPTKALMLTKKALNRSMNNDLETQLQCEDDLQTQAGGTSDFAEGVQAFLEKRKPNFTGN
ncbi:MAG: 2-(1,2-epoxy-1,2-dihydrophenyl)acetyl-CoA isomerase [Cryomorphaceae bacterium]|nr:2-(1,2-epoxy-1,2-dihydrophenyl)acetyl-CoA isomerase [Cryomorphaceae bacterium]